MFPQYLNVLVLYVVRCIVLLKYVLTIICPNHYLFYGSLQVLSSLKGGVECRLMEPRCCRITRSILQIWECHKDVEVCTDKNGSVVVYFVAHLQCILVDTVICCIEACFPKQCLCQVWSVFPLWVGV